MLFNRATGSSLCMRWSLVKALYLSIITLVRFVSLVRYYTRWANIINLNRKHDSRFRFLIEVEHM